MGNNESKIYIFSLFIYKLVTEKVIRYAEQFAQCILYILELTQQSPISSHHNNWI